MAESIFDYIVVGGGSGGAVVAARLSEDPNVSVALIEAGPTDIDNEVVLDVKRWSEVLELGHDWDYPVEPQEQGNSFLRHSRAKLLGGCSSHNGCIAFWAPKEDLDGWEQLGAAGWNADVLFPYYSKLESNTAEGDHHGRTGPVLIRNVPPVEKCGNALLDACETLGMPRVQFNSGETVVNGANFFQVNAQEDGTRGSSSVSYIHPILGRPNFTLITDTQVTEVLFSETSAGEQRASGVKVVDNPYNRARVLHAAEEVILSAGVIDSPKLLMLSGIGPREHLEELGIAVRVDSQGVGSHLQDHPEAVISWEAKLPIDEGAVVSWWDVGVFYATEEGLDRPDLMMHFGTMPFDMHTARHGYPSADNAITLTPNVTRARSRGTVRLRTSDYRDKPKIDPRYFTDPEGHDIRVLVDGIKLARRIVDEPAMSEWAGRELFPGKEIQTDEELVEFIKKTHNTVYHPAGTVRMGADDDAQSPLDARLRVKGVERLRVVDASVMPALTTVNPNITVYMIGERAADLIKEDRAARV